MPAAAFQLTTVILAALFTTYIRKSRLIALVAIFLMALAGILMVKLLPDTKKLSRLAGFWLVTAVAPAFPLMMSMFASNTAGFTKKSSVVALIFVGYCVGNFVGPQFFKNTEAPAYGVRPYYNPLNDKLLGCRLVLTISSSRRHTQQSSLATQFRLLWLLDSGSILAG